MKKKKVLFISSTGGHFSEMMQLKAMFDNYDYHIITEKTKSHSKNLKQKYGKRVSFLIHGTKEKPFSYIFKLTANCFMSLYYFIKIRPKYIITTGAHTAGPICCIGKIFRTKIIFIESFANVTTKTVTGSLVYKFADLFIVQWPDMQKLYPKAIYPDGGVF